MIRDLSLILVSVLLSSIITIFFLVKDPPRIVVVDDQVLFKDFIVAISNSIESSDQDEIEKKIKTHKVAVDIFNERIDQIATERNLLVLKKSVVMAGSEDQTNQAQKLLGELIKEVENDK